jgi:hypothetical protein
MRLGKITWQLDTLIDRELHAAQVDREAGSRDRQSPGCNAEPENNIGEPGKATSGVRAVTTELKNFSGISNSVAVEHS